MDNEENEDLKTAEQIRLLHAHKDAIIADLDVSQIIPFLLEQLVLSHDDKQRIEHEVTLKDKSNKLLNILETNAVANPHLDIIPIFIESLQKEYDWLYKSLTEIDVPDSKAKPAVTNQPDEDDNVFESPKHHRVKTMLEAGGVNCPVVAVERKQLVETVRLELRHLKRSQFLVIQGMAGCGKSILAQQALNSAALIKNVFPDGVFMLAIGKECSESKDAIMAKVRILCDKLEETRAPISLEHGAEMLRGAFLKRPNALLVLDGVWRTEVIRSFDVGCAVMVTTRDVSVMDVVQGRATLLRIDSGFSEAESLELFRRTLSFSQVGELPEAAKTIHYTSKGSPMVVSLISSLLQDHPDEIRDEGRWSYYLDALSKRRYSKIRRNRDYEHESIYDAISLSVDSLTEKKRNYYHDFALFQDDVSIPCPVLEILWSLERYEVEDIMKHFVKKSLICEEVHPSRNWHIYSIHSLQLDYLKYQLQCSSTEEDVGSCERRLHERLISQYQLKCDSEFEKLPDDDYIHFYLGYHLHKSRQVSLFPQIYLNLLFVGEKLRLCGPADLLTDLRKYREFIAGETEERTRLFDEIQGFAELVGYVKYGQEDVDIVQLALQNPKFELLQERAREIALSQPSRLYFEWLGADMQQWKNPESSVVCSEGVRCVKFVGEEGNLFLVGLNDGSIELCDMSSCGVLWRFFGHTDTVHCLATYDSFSGDGNKPLRTKHLFLSTSEDETCKIWTTLDNVIETEGHNSRYRRDDSGNNSPSPKIRNSKWTFEKVVDDQSSFTFQFHTAPVMSAEFSPSGKEVVSGSANEILVWNSEDGQVLQKLSNKTSPSASLSISSSLTPFLSCHFGPMTEGEVGIPYLLFGTGNQLCLFPLHQPSIFTSVEASHMNIVSVLFFAPDWICTVSEHDIGLWKVEKGESESVQRRKSLSPRRSFPLTPFPGNGSPGRKTEVDAVSSTAWKSRASNSGRSRFLLPPTKLEGFSNNGGDGASPIKYSASKYSLTPSTLSATIDTGEYFVRIVREHIIPKRTAGLFNCAAITQDHEDLLLACGTSNMKICLFNLLTKEFLGEFSTHTGLLRCLDFSKVDEWTLLSGSEDQTVMVWDIKEEIAAKKLSQKRPEFDAVFVESPGRRDSGHFLSMCSTDVSTIQFYQNSVLLQETSKMRSDITIVCLSNCGTYIVFGTESGAIYRLQQIPEKRNPSIENGFQNSSTPELIGDLEDPVQFLQFDPTSEFLIGISSYGGVQILKKFSLHHQFQLSRRNVVGVHFPFNKHVAIVCEHKRGPLVFLDLDGKVELKGYDDPELGYITSSAMKLDSSCIALGTREDGISLCTLRLGVGVLRGTVINSTHKSAISALAFSPDSTKLAVGFKNGLITIWDLSASSHVEGQNLVLHKSHVRHLLFSPFEIGDRRWLVSCGDRLAVWSLEKPVEQIQKTSFMAERRRRKSGDSRPSSRLSLELPTGIKIGKQGKRELLNSFYFRGSFAKLVVSDPSFTQFVTVDNTGIFYLLRIMKLEES